MADRPIGDEANKETTKDKNMRDTLQYTLDTMASISHWSTTALKKFNFDDIENLERLTPLLNQCFQIVNLEENIILLKTAIFDEDEKSKTKLINRTGSSELIVSLTENRNQTLNEIGIRQPKTSSGTPQITEMTSEVLKSKKEFISFICHEMRSPMTRVSGFITTLLDPEVVWDDSEKKDFLNIVKSGLEQIREEYEKNSPHLLINERYTNLTSADLSTVFSSAQANIEEIRHDAIGEATKARATHEEINLLENISIDINTPTDLPNTETEIFSKELLQSVIKNMISNSIKSALSKIRLGHQMPEGIKIRIQVQDINGRKEIVCTDNGAGLSEFDEDPTNEIIEFQASKTTWRGGIQGTGLGMYSLRSIIRSINLQNKNNYNLFLRRNSNEGESNCACVLQIPLSG